MGNTFANICSVGIIPLTKDTVTGGNAFRLKTAYLLNKGQKLLTSVNALVTLRATYSGRLRPTEKGFRLLVERISRKLFAVRVPQTKCVVDGFKLLLKPYRDILKSITFDNGPKNGRHLELKTKTYFCHPFSSWEKGQIENTLGRLRRFIKKKSSLNLYSDEDIARFVEKMNNTPRKCLGYKTPNEVFNELLIKERGEKAEIRKILVVHLRGQRRH